MTKETWRTHLVIKYEYSPPLPSPCWYSFGPSSSSDAAAGRELTSSSQVLSSVACATPSLKSEWGNPSLFIRGNGSGELRLDDDGGSGVDGGDDGGGNADIGGECWRRWNFPCPPSLSLSPSSPSPWEKVKSKSKQGHSLPPPPLPRGENDGERRRGGEREREEEKEGEGKRGRGWNDPFAPGASESVPMDAAAASSWSYSAGTGGKCEKFLLKDSNRVARVAGA